MTKAEDMVITVTLDDESKELLRLIADRLSVQVATEATGKAKRLIEQQVAEEFHTGPIMVQRSSSQAGLSSIR